MGGIRAVTRRAAALSLIAALLSVFPTAAGLHAAGQIPALFESVRLRVPTLVHFDVVNVSQMTPATGGPTRIEFDDGVITPGRVVRISVKADGDLVPASGSPVDVSAISWTTSGAISGAGLSGALSKTTFTPVFEGTLLATSGRVDVVWTLLSRGPELRAGPLQVTLRWKVESVIP